MIKKFSSEKRSALIMLAAMITAGVALIYIFFLVNDSYIKYIELQPSNVVINLSARLLNQYFSVALYFVLFFVACAIAFFEAFEDDTDISLMLIITYLIILLLNTINDFNIKSNQLEVVFDTICGLLYEISVVPLVLYLTLKMKKYKKKMLVLLLLEVISGLLFIIGSTSSGDSPLSILKNISGDLVFIIIFLDLCFFAVLEYYEGNIAIKKYAANLLVTVIIFLIFFLLSFFVRNSYFSTVFSAICNLDFAVIKKDVLQNIMIISIVINFTTEYIKKETQKQESLRIVALEADLSIQYSESLKSRINDVRRIKHDMSDHLNVISMLYDQGDFDKMKSYISEIQNDISSVSPLSYSDNIIADYLLMNFSEQAKTSGVSYEANAVIGENVGIPDGELCSLISNIIKNAIEACERLAPDSEKYLKFLMYKKDDKLIVKCENTCVPSTVIHDDENCLRTVKKDKHSHGFGISIIQNICEKHNGAVVFDCVDSIFNLKAVIPLE